jgi:hypothetical protein
MSEPVRRGPIKRGVSGSKPRIVLPIAAIAAVAETTNYLVVIERYRKKIKNPKTAIRAKCVECSGGSLKEVQECRVTDCALHPFRMGENPFHLKTIQRLQREGGEGTDNDNDEENE